MLDLLNPLLWIVAATLLAVLDRTLRSHKVLTAVAGACLASAVTAVIFGPNFALESTVCVLVAAPLIYSSAIHISPKNSCGQNNGIKDNNAVRLIGTISLLSSSLNKIIFTIAFMTLIYGIVVSVVEVQRPANEVFGALAAVCGVMTTYIASLRYRKASVLTLLGTIGFCFGGLVTTAIIATIRFYLHGPDS